jgi:hypothetical protein
MLTILKNSILTLAIAVSKDTNLVFSDRTSSKFVKLGTLLYKVIVPDISGVVRV